MASNKTLGRKGLNNNNNNNNKPTKEENKNIVDILKDYNKCCKCGTLYYDIKKWFPISYSSLYLGNESYLPICNDCINTLLLEYQKTFNDEYKAFRSVCMCFNIYYNKELVDITLKNSKPQERMTMYISKSNTPQFSNRTFFDTLREEEAENRKIKSVEDVLNGKGNQDDVKKWGFGFSETDYIYLNEKYNSWISRHECKTMAQEEIYKKLSLLDLQIIKNTIDGEKIEGLYKQYNDYLSSANIKPIQQNDIILADTNTFGTYIKKIEETRPISEPNEEWKDVDGIKKYISVIIGHLCKMFSLKNKFSELCDKELEKYTVTPITYEEEEHASFDDIFGNLD